MTDHSRGSRNRDNLKRLNYPRQTYAFSGIDWGDADLPVRIRRKLNILDAPMIITPMPPGALASNNVSWQQTYGASMDCIMSLIDGRIYNENIVASAFAFDSTYSQSLPTAQNNNLYQVLDGKQQIQFVTGKSDVAIFRQQAATPLLPAEVRSLGIRAPVQMCGWGHTIGMRPTDPEPANPRINDNEHKFDRSTWPLGPLDARWDSRRKTWRAFNDLIADDEGKNLGTLVFSTNPDDKCGFPFLRGKLEDVWSVVRTFREVGTEGAAKTDDITKSALLTTKLGSFAIGGSSDTGAALIATWADVLVIHDKCFSGFEATCGTERTQDATMGILTQADFLQSPTRLGPIAFAQPGPLGPDVILGQMFYEEPPGGGACGVWKPGITIGKDEDFDICEVAKHEFDILFKNDEDILLGLIDLCNQIGNTGGNGDGGEDVEPEPNGTFIQRINQNRDWLKSSIDIAIDHVSSTASVAGATSSALDSIQIWEQEIRPNIEKEIQSMGTAVAAGASDAIKAVGEGIIEACFTAINDGLQALADEILAKCDCVVGATQAEPPSVDVPTIIVPEPDIQPELDLDTEVIILDGLEVGLDVTQGLYDSLKGEITDATDKDNPPPPDPDDIDEEPEEADPTLSVTICDPCTLEIFTEEC